MDDYNDKLKSFLLTIWLVFAAYWFAFGAPMAVAAAGR